MSRTDKKVISIFLLLIILLAQISPVFATTEPAEAEITLTQYLIKNGVDANEDNVLSDAEWATVKNLELVADEVDCTNIEKAVNLKSLTLQGIDPNEVDFTKLNNLEKLYIDLEGYNFDSPINIVLPKLDKLKELTIINSNVYEDIYNEEQSIISSSIGKIDISNLNNIEKIDFNYTYICELIFPNLENIKEFYIANNNSISLDLSNATNLMLGEIMISEEINTVETVLPNVTVANNMFVEETWSKGLEITKVNSKIDLQRGAIFARGTCSNLEENDVLEIDADGHILAKGIGTKQVVVKDILNRTHTIEFNVYKKEIDTTLGKTAMDVEIIDDEKILKANGELWKITSDTTAQQVGTNVKKYVSSLVYCQTGGGYAEIEKLLKTDNSLTLTIDINGTKTNKSVTNVTAVSEDEPTYVSNGNLYEVTMNYITEEVTTELVMTNVDKIVGDLVISNGCTYYKNETGVYEKIADFEAVICYKYYRGIYLVDENNITWEYEIETKTLVQIESYSAETYLEEDEEYTWWDNYEEEFLHCGDVIVLKDIARSSYNYEFDCYIYIRKDGSLWLYSENSGLTKVVESTAAGEENLEATPVKETIKTKDAGNIKVITGLPTEKTVTTWVYESNLDKNFIVQVYELTGKKIYDSNEYRDWEYDEETDEYIRVEDVRDLQFKTGMKIVLTSGNVKQEYSVVIYGDINGDGSINAFDALMVIRGANKKVEFTSEAQKEAGRIIAKSGEEPTAVDALAIIKSINNKYTINQYK